MASLPSVNPSSTAAAAAANANNTNNTTTAADAQPPRPSTISFENDPAMTGYDPRQHWFVNYVRIRLGQVTAEGAQHYREDRYRANEQRDCARCEQWRDWTFAHSPVVRFLREKVAALNGDLDAHNVVCRRCPARRDAAGGWHRMAAGFDPQHGIQLCANELGSRAHLEEALAHEMVHAWDHLRFKMDWVGDTDLRHAACTEIRAAMLSGECRWTKETFTRGNLQLTQQFQNCVRMRAVMSVMARPRCKDDVQAVKVVNEVWDSCFSDKRPFDDIFR